MTAYGENKSGVFHPGNPNLEDLLEKSGLSDWSGMEKTSAGAELSSNMRSADHDIKMAAYKLSKSNDGKIVLDYLIGQTLRRSPYKFAQGQTIEQTMPYVIERAGQNAAVIFLLNMIVEGQRLSEAEKKVSKAKKSKKK